MAWALCSALPALLSAVNAAAQVEHVDNRCARLSGSEYEELDARVQLLLRGEEAPLPLPAVVCEGAEAWLEWQGQRYALHGRGSLVDEAVDVIERQLHDSQRTTKANAQQLEDEAVAAGEPVLNSTSGSGKRRSERPAGGGLTVGIETEAPANGVPLVLGPAFDFAGSVGPLMIGGREAFRFGVGERNVLFMDFEAVLAYGAPLDPDKMFGVETRLGAEWMVVYSDGDYGQASVAPIASIGLRVAKRLSPSFSAWLGLDARFRLQKLSVRSENPMTASDVGAAMTIGAAYTNWTRK